MRPLLFQKRNSPFLEVSCSFVASSAVVLLCPFATSWRACAPHQLVSAGGSSILYR